jgi:putative sterol carrier protein
MAHAYVPGSAGGFTGELQYELRRNGHVVPWTLRIDGTRAHASAGPASAAAVTVKVTTADFLRIAGGELDPARALLLGRLDLEGDFALAQRLGEMFGRPPAL